MDEEILKCTVCSQWIHGGTLDNRIATQLRHITFFPFPKTIWHKHPKPIWMRDEKYGLLFYFLLFIHEILLLSGTANSLVLYYILNSIQ